MRTASVLDGLTVRSIMTLGQGPSVMRVSLVLLMMLTAPLLAATPALAEEATIMWSDAPKTADVIAEYSGAVQRALLRAEMLERYDDVTIAKASTWLIITSLELDIQQRLPGAPEQIEAAPLLAGAWLWTYDEPSRALKSTLAGRTAGALQHASPQIERQHTPRYVVNDPEFNAQWHLQNTGQTSGVVGEDANVTAAWNTVNGSGVTISIVDDGFAHSNADLSPGYLSNLSWDWCGGDSDPNPSSSDGHGTSAAGVAGARGDDNNDVSGAAYMANLSGQRLIACWSPDATEASALSFENQSNDIYSNSWGPSDDAQTLEAPGPLMTAAFENDIALGRGGLGNIITWAAGNGLGNGDDSNYDGYANHRATIAVTAITHRGEQAYYAEPGSNILVAAHSNGDGESITTSDIPGSGGYNSSGDVTHTFGGTSSATPLVSGVIALILQANPNLTWRDVQHVLVNSGRINDPTDNDWVVNGAGHNISHKYGFGAIDAHAAITLARNWTNVGQEMDLSSAITTVGTSIPDSGGTAVTDTIQVTSDISVETAEVALNISHNSRGDLEILLTSPAGTVSTLAELHADTGNDYSAWSFSTVHNWDEDSVGNWTLSVRDRRSGTTGTFDDWQLILYGVDVDRDSDGDGLTDANETTIHGTDPTSADTDSDGLSDGDEVLNLSTDPNNPDSDGDGLGDGVEVFVNGTDPLDPDTDGDGLSDGAEVNVHNSDPLLFDEDADSDLYYWFDDCNDTNSSIRPGALELLNGIDDDCDDEIDEGYSGLDSDQDGLDDYDEFHNYSTNPNDADSDGDGLSDGEEIYDFGTDPLIADADADGDGWHAFRECDDNNSSRHPAMMELLNGIDDNCDDRVDEGFSDVDTDSDGLDDYAEYHNYSTDVASNDSDGDGLNDGQEVLINGTNPLLNDTDLDGISDGDEVNSFGSDPLLFDDDADLDGFYWFSDCDENSSGVNPDANETWNHIDDNCDGTVDENITRGPFFTRTPNSSSTTVHHLTSAPYNLSWSVPNELLLNASWSRSGRVLMTSDMSNRSYSESAVDCNSPIDDFQTTLCTHFSRLITYSVTVTDGNESISFSWSVRFTADPAMPEPNDDDDSENSNGSHNGTIDDSTETGDAAENSESELDKSEDSEALSEMPLARKIAIGIGFISLLAVIIWSIRFTFDKRYNELPPTTPRQMIDRQRAAELPRAPDFGKQRR